MITVKDAPAKEEPQFVPGTLYMSDMYHRNGNVYLIVGPGSAERYVAAVRLAGSDFQYSDTIVKSCLVPFEGEVVIKND